MNEKDTSVMLNVKVPPSLKERLTELAKQDGRLLSGLVRKVLTEAASETSSKKP